MDAGTNHALGAAEGEAQGVLAVVDDDEDAGDGLEKFEQHGRIVASERGRCTPRGGARARKLESAAGAAPSGQPRSTVPRGEGRPVNWRWGGLAPAGGVCELRLLAQPVSLTAPLP